jgi:predicted nucleic acid-binding protein
MAYLVDTTILGRLANASDAQHAVAARAVLELHRRGEVLHVTPQVLVEFRNVATRPVAVNGLGLPPADAEALTAMFEARFPLLAEAPDIYMVVFSTSSRRARARTSGCDQLSDSLAVQWW